MDATDPRESILLAQATVKQVLGLTSGKQTALTGLRMMGQLGHRLDILSVQSLSGEPLREQLMHKVFGSPMLLIIGN